VAGCRSGPALSGPRVTRVTLIEPDVLQAAQRRRHLSRSVPSASPRPSWPGLARERRPDWTCASYLRPPGPAASGMSSRRPPPRMLASVRGQRTGQVSLGRLDARFGKPGRSASAQRRHRRLSSTGSCPAARATAVWPATCSAPVTVDKAPPRLFAAGRPGGRDHHPRQQGVHPGDLPPCTPW